MSTRDQELTFMLKLVNRVTAPASKIDRAMKDVQGEIKKSQVKLNKFSESLNQVKSWHSKLNIQDNFSSVGNKIADVRDKAISLGNSFISSSNKLDNFVTNSAPFEYLKGFTSDIITSLESIDDSTIKRVTDSLGASVVGVVDNIASFGIPTINMLSDTVTSMNNVMTTSSKVAGFISTVATDAITGVNNLMETSQKVTGVMGKVGSLVKSHPILAIISLIAAGALLIISNWDAIVAWAAPYWQKLTAIFSTAWNGIKSFFLNWTPLGLFMQHWDAIVAWAAPYWQKLSGIFSAAWDGIKSFFFNWTPLSLFIQHWDAIVAWAAPFWQKLSGIFSMAWEGIKSFFFNWTPLGLFIQHWDAIVAWATPYWQRLTTIFSTAWEGIKSFFSSWNPVTLFTQIWDNVTTYFSGLPSRLAESGRNIIAGLGLGIEEKVQWIKDKVTGLGDSLANWFQEKLGIHSPSRVFAALGSYISEGVGVGIEDNSNSALNAVQRLSKRLPGALPTAMAIGLTATAANASPISAGPAVGTSGGQVVVHQYNTFHIQTQPGDDHQAIAKAIAAELDKRERQASARSRSRLYDEE